jgi:hypothetical protein
VHADSGADSGADPRLRLEAMIDEIAARAKARLRLSRNVAKGDRWTRESYWWLGNRAFGADRRSEVTELMDIYTDGHPYDGNMELALDESGDVLAFMAMLADKFKEDIERYRPAVATLEEASESES